MGYKRRKRRRTRTREAVQPRGRFENGLFGDIMRAVGRNLFLLLCFVFAVVAFSFVTWKVLALITGAKSPVVMIVSGSMEPGFTRGDILFMRMNNDPIRAGDIIDFEVEGLQFGIVHRVIKVHERRDSKEIYVLTKGDKNVPDDLQAGFYAPGQEWLERRHIMGRAFRILPHVGRVFIAMLEMSRIQYIIFGALGLLVIILYQMIRLIF